VTVKRALSWVVENGGAHAPSRAVFDGRVGPDKDGPTRLPALLPRYAELRRNVTVRQRVVYEEPERSFSVCTRHSTEESKVS